MGRRPLEIQDAIDRGKLWNDFKKTAWYTDLKSHLEESIARAKDICVEATISGDSNKAHVEAARVSGLREALDFIDGNVQDLQAIAEHEQADRDYQAEIPTHVKGV